MTGRNADLSEEIDVRRVNEKDGRRGDERSVHGELVPPDAQGGARDADREEDEADRGGLEGAEPAGGQGPVEAGEREDADADGELADGDRDDAEDGREERLDDGRREGLGPAAVVQPDALWQGDMWGREKRERGGSEGTESTMAGRGGLRARGTGTDLDEPRHLHPDLSEIQREKD